MYSSMLANGIAVPSRLADLVALSFFALYLAGASASNTSVGQAIWFPDKPAPAAYEWHYAPCKGCAAVEPQRDWLRMQHLAGLAKVHFVVAPDEQWGDAYSYPPDALVLSPAALNLPRCQLDFVIGHELVHLAMRDFDEDAHTAAVLSGFSPTWTHNGKRALSLLDGNIVLALKMSSDWQAQERRADWVGALLSAEGGGCTLEDGALPYMQSQTGYGGGIAAAHEPSMERAHFLMGFAEPAERLASRW